LGLLRVSPSTEMNSETVSPIPPRAFNSRRKEISVTPAIGESTSGGLISMSRILKGLISFIKKPHEILPHVAGETGTQAFSLANSPSGTASETLALRSDLPINH